jgi:hypothetical protein
MFKKKKLGLCLIIIEFWSNNDFKNHLIIWGTRDTQEICKITQKAMNLQNGLESSATSPHACVPISSGQKPCTKYFFLCLCFPSNPFYLTSYRGGQIIRLPPTDRLLNRNRIDIDSTDKFDLTDLIKPTLST